MLFPDWVDNRTYVRYHEEMKKPTELSGGVFDEDGSAAMCDIATLNEELAAIDNDELETSIVDLHRRIEAQQAQLLLRIAEYDSRDLGRLRHLLTTAGWLRQALRLTSAGASRLVRTARTLARVPSIAAEAAEGRITSDGLRLLTLARNRHPDRFGDHEEVFAEIATYLTTKELRQAIEHWEQQVDFPSAIERVRDQRRRRRLSLSQTWEGMWHLTAELDAETGSVIDTAIRTIVDRENLVASREGSSDRRLPWQRRADALGDICDFWLGQSDTIGTSGGSKPTLTVTTSLEMLLGLTQKIPTIDGMGTDPENLRRIVCDSSVIRILIDADGEPLSVSRRFRTVTPAIRRALDLRDGGCRWNGCGAPASWCDAHHLIHWADGGPTSLDNTVLLCRSHHRAAHETSRVDHETRVVRAPP
jgi:uncharacterized small protein (DUF1192 family)